MPLFQSIVDTIAQSIFNKEQQKDNVLNENYNENKLISY